jgi:hypothetical protein
MTTGRTPLVAAPDIVTWPYPACALHELAVTIHHPAHSVEALPDRVGRPTAFERLKPVLVEGEAGIRGLAL